MKNKIKSIEVLYNGIKVGDIAQRQDMRAVFEYAREWQNGGFSISPFSLPLRNGIFTAKGFEPFDGSFGVFADSLPDGWGRLLTDRMLLKENIDPRTVGFMERLAIVGSSEQAMGALSYKPTLFECGDTQVDERNLDSLAKNCREIFEETTGDFDTLFNLASPSGGARPKLMAHINGSDWIVKFPSPSDKKNIGEMEYNYSLCAKACGIEMAETKLFDSRISSGWFGTKRFDRIDKNGKTIRVHKVSTAALLETDYRIPNLDYNILMKLVFALTHNAQEAEKLFRLMCFNVFAHNRDDHSKNFSFLYDEDNSAWRLAPAYDLTYSNSIGGEHATTIDGEGAHPDIADILRTAAKAGIESAKAKEIAGEIKERVFDMLGSYVCCKTNAV